MTEAIERYLLLRKHLGYKDADLWRDLRAFGKFAADRGALYLRNEDVLAWIRQRKLLARRQELIASFRRLGLFLRAEDASHEVLGAEHISSTRRSGRPMPFIYTSDEIRRILAELASLPLPHAYDAATYKHIVGLIAATGLRINEARNILTQDFGKNEIFIRRGKFGKDRIVHIHSSTDSALRKYLAERPSKLRTDNLFVLSNNNVPSKCAIQVNFRKCTNGMKLVGRNGSSLPRIHDLRHTFAVRSLANCGLDRNEISNHMVALSTYMGHVSIASTYWYLEITTETKETMALAIEEMLSAG